jgi:hypothetical protein
MQWPRPETCVGQHGMPRTLLARPGSSRTSPRTNSARPPMRSRPHALARRKARATAQGDASAGGSVTSSRRRFASSYLTTSGCGTTSAGRCLTAERASGAPAPPTTPLSGRRQLTRPARRRPTGTPRRRRRLSGSATQGVSQDRPVKCPVKVASSRCRFRLKSCAWAPPHGIAERRAGGQRGLEHDHSRKPDCRDLCCSWHEDPPSVSTGQHGPVTAGVASVVARSGDATTTSGGRPSAVPRCQRVAPR